MALQGDIDAATREAEAEGLPRDEIRQALSRHADIYRSGEEENLHKGMASL